MKIVDEELYDTVLMENFDLQDELLIDFLINAKRATYANEMVKKAKSSRRGSSDYEYEEVVDGEKMVYHDTYFGGTRFMGNEVVYKKEDTPRWGMVYYGVTLDDSLSEEVMDSVLRPALMEVGIDDKVLPLRGPSKFTNGIYEYTFKCKGDINNFSGDEKITRRGTVIYELHVEGGRII